MADPAWTPATLERKLHLLLGSAPETTRRRVETTEPPKNPRFAPKHTSTNFQRETLIRRSRRSRRNRKNRRRRARKKKKKQIKKIRINEKRRAQQKHNTSLKTSEKQTLTKKHMEAGKPPSTVPGLELSATAILTTNLSPEIRRFFVYFKSF